MRPTFANWKNIVVGTFILLVLAFLVFLPAFVSAQGNYQGSINGTLVEMKLHENQMITVRGAKVTSISGTTIFAGTTIGPSTINWIVKTSSTTEFITRGSGTSSLPVFSVGDYLSFNSVLDKTQQFSVQAFVVKNWSLGGERSLIPGKVQTIDTMRHRLTLSSESYGFITVLISTSTELQKNGNNLTFAAIAVGDTLRVAGIYNDKNQTLVAEKVTVNLKAKDSELPKETSRGRVSQMFKIWADRLGLNFVLDR